eukprot:TRINITY_DN1265_c0_g3_i1.p1 TRINITY_DN1265_c0_g3~~TRINITY_DN1265_c0_g3_i1.p1  ORF type:complete len:241 (+),score=62.46 TRINITY_DN1265_c0_g3_i1:90-812(+)
MEKPCCIGTVQSEDALKGTVSKVDDLQIYVSRPEKTPEVAVICWHDIYGFFIPNSRLQCDWLASLGYLAVMGDLYRGDAWTPSHDWAVFGQWIGKFTQEQLNKDFDTIRAFVTKEFPTVKKFAAIGYCWGGKQVALAARTGALSAGISFHGIGFDVEDIKESKCPVAYFVPENDQYAPQEAREAFAKTFAEHPEKGLIKIYAGCTHGFAVRGDYENPAEKKGLDDVRADAAAFFAQHVPA